MNANFSHLPMQACLDDSDDDNDCAHRWLDSHDWDDLDDDLDDFDPEPPDGDIDDEFEIDAIPDDPERPPEELWNDADWE